MQYSFIDSVPTEDDIGNYDSIVEYRTEDFEDFQKLVKDLCEFRKKNRDINQTYKQKLKHVDQLQHDLTDIDGIGGYIENDEVWKEKVADLKRYYLENTKYDEVKAELAELEHQKEIMENIKSEFKIQTSQTGMCTICSERPVSVFLDPCGHVSCAECINSLTSSRREHSCPFCRGSFIQKRVYMV